MTHRIVETLSGYGDVLQSSCVLAAVRYQITVRQEILITESFTGRSELPGLKSITGNLIMDNSTILPPGDGLILRLDDGRQLSILVERASLGRASILGNGGFF